MSDKKVEIATPVTIRDRDRSEAQVAYDLMSRIAEYNKCHDLGGMSEEKAREYFITLYSECSEVVKHRTHKYNV